MCSFRQSQTSHVILSTCLYVYMCKCAFFDDFILTNGIILAIKYTYIYLNNPLRHMSSYHEPHIRNMSLSRHSHTLHVLISAITYVTCAHLDNPIRYMCSYRQSHTLYVLISTFPYVTCAHLDIPIRYMCSYRQSHTLHVLI